MTVAAARQTDRRIQRTRDALRDALLALMTERGWEGTSVQDICERANVARSTFYLHYNGKDELLQGGFQSLQMFLQTPADEGIVDVANGNWAGFRFSLGLIEHAYENRRLFRNMIGRRSGFPVQQRFREMVLRLIDHELPTPTGDLPRAAVVRQLAAAFTELVAWSVDQKTPMPAEKLAAAFDRVAVSLLAIG
ncbi:MAG: TetR/AcrR family transcriptional regulator [Xanthomonadales bacterium]|nr:TetR/AcrR family transcriptional regulator [Xanthomonadales bacterium]